MAAAKLGSCRTHNFNPSSHSFSKGHRLKNVHPISLLPPSSWPSRLITRTTPRNTQLIIFLVSTIMNLNCLQATKITDSESEMRNTLCQEKSANIHRLLAKFDRSWSGDLTPSRPQYNKMRTGSVLMADKEAKKHHFSRTHLHHSAPAVFDENASPRLMRSSGMRRDWSFEDLRTGVKGY